MTVARSLRIGFGGLGTPVILQNEAAECGLACLAMVAAAHGLHVDLPALRQRFNLSLKGATMADLATMAHALKLQTRAVRAEPEQLGQLPLPAILHWDFNHFVVLVKIGRDAVLIHDPARGAHWVKWARLSRHFTGAAMELTPTQGSSVATSSVASRCASCWGGWWDSSGRWRRSSRWRWCSSSSCC